MGEWLEGEIGSTVTGCENLSKDTVKARKEKKNEATYASSLPSLPRSMHRVTPSHFSHFPP